MAEKCPECNSESVSFDSKRAETVCNKCGIVIDERQIDTTQEWRAFDYEQRKKRDRTGSFLTYTRHDKGLSTSIGDQGYSDLYKLSPSKRASFYRLKRWHKQVSTATERNLRFALSELDRISSTLSLPKNIRETTALIYRKAVTKGLVRGRSMESVVAAALYAACRKHNVPRTLDEIAEASNVKKREIGRTYRFITRELKIRLLPTSPIDYISRFSSSLKLSPLVQEEAIKILKQAQEHDLVSGRGPTGVAAAAIYVSSTLSNEKRTQREVAEVAGVTEVTIRNRYKELIEELGIADKMSEASAKDD
ncbi:TPA: transcription initiation factor IIB [archaeon]|jgi:transcription initiation factor TFIIB|uniref:Transcription initiation factor IIB n=1 Tax=Candidatus Undinarchaeum marinum TaxID=2756141 RepID=A0A832V935_9ARCH|nr:transcription initiation factor IIB [Candidatus Undinarchaeum marinum]